MKKLCMILPLALILCFMVSCQDKEAMVELEQFRAQAKVEEQNIEVVKRFFEGLNKGNIDIMNEVCVPDYKFYSPPNNPQPMTREEQIEVEKMFLKAFPDRIFRIDKLFTDGDTVIIQGIGTGIHQKEFEGIPATGNKLEFSFIETYRCENGKIVESRQELDYLGAWQQLGLELKPKEEEK